MYNMNDISEKLAEFYDKLVEKSIRLGEKFPFNYVIEKLNQLSEQIAQDIEQEMIETERLQEEYEQKVAPIRDENLKQLNTYHQFLSEQYNKKR